MTNLINKTSNWLKDKKAQQFGMFSILMFVVTAIVVTMFLAMMVFGFDQLNTALQNIPVSGTSGINISQAAADTFGQVNAQMHQLSLIAFIIIFMNGFAIFIINYNIKAHPILFIVYMVFVSVAVIVSAEVSNAYESLIPNPTIGATLTSFNAASHVLLNLPAWTAIIGVIGGIFLFIGILRDRELSDSI